MIHNSFGDYDDFIELFNSGNQPVNIKNYRINDDLSFVNSYVLPDYIIPSGGRVLVFASGSNARDPIHHYEMPVNGHGIWKYQIGSNSLDDNWRDLEFDDSGWLSGPGGIGFGDNDDGTTIPQSQSVMMRSEFFISDSTQVHEAFLFMDYDDGFIAYLNGVEIARANMNFNNPPWNVFATYAHEAVMYQGMSPDSFHVDRETLFSAIRSGKNILSVQTHNVEANSSDLTSTPFLIIGVSDSSINHEPVPSWFREPSEKFFTAPFKLSRTGETVYLFKPDTTIADQVSYPALESDHCYARITDANPNWCINDNPTPMYANNSARCFLGYTSQPAFSEDEGFYQGQLIVELNTSMPGGLVRYTTNGDVPDSSSAIYSGPIQLNQSTIVRARVFAANYLPGKIVSHTFLIDEESRLPVITLATDSVNLWDEHEGIYVLGLNAAPNSPYFGANFWQPWSKPANIAIFDKAKQRIINFNADIEIYGNYSRAKPQKSFEISLGDRYGMDELFYPLIRDKSFIKEHRKIILRNAGTDWNVVHFRDGLMERIMKSTHSGYIASQPARVFLNGADWGVYLITEKHNHIWIEANHELDAGEYDYLVEEGNNIHVEKGSDDDFWITYNYLTTNNPTQESYYDFADSKFNLKNYTDYFIAETYYNNGDWIGEWTNNIKLWKKKKAGSKWNYLMHDLDFGLGLKGRVSDNRLELARNPIEFSHSSEMFDRLLENERFKNYFINRYADLMNTIFLPSNVENVMKQFRDSMIFDMHYHFNKWGSDTVQWQSRINSMLSFANQRPSISRQMINDMFGLGGNVNITMNVNPPDAGRIEISTVISDSYPWTGVYFNGNPVRITAIPNPGFTFSHWSSGYVSASSGQSTIVNFLTDDLLTANFTGFLQDPQLTVSEFNYHSHPDFDGGEWIELHNYSAFNLDLSGWRLKDGNENHEFKFPTGTVIRAGHYLVLVQDSVLFDSYYPDVENRIGNFDFKLNNAGEEIRLLDHAQNLFLSFYYQPYQPWPTKSDGFGFTNELTTYSAVLSDGNNWGTGCFGGSPGTSRSNMLSIKIPVTGNNYICEGKTAVLKVRPIPESTILWHRNNQTIAGAVADSLSINKNGYYYVYSEVLGCEGESQSMAISVRKNAADPFVSHGLHCGPGKIFLSARGDETIRWFENITSEAVHAGEIFQTEILETSQTYYVQHGDLCPGRMLPVNAIISSSCDEKISVFPNPSRPTQDLNISLNDIASGDILIEITDMKGSKIFSKEMELGIYDTMIQIPDADLPRGVYTLSVISLSELHTARIIRF